MTDSTKAKQGAKAPAVKEVELLGTIQTVIDGKSFLLKPGKQKVPTELLSELKGKGLIK